MGHYWHSYILYGKDGTIIRSFDNMKPTYYEVLWHNCCNCRIHYMNEQPHTKAYLCDDCWNKLPHYKATNLPKRKKTLDTPMKDWPLSWIVLYTTGCMVLTIIIGYYLWLK